MNDDEPTDIIEIIPKDEDKEGPDTYEVLTGAMNAKLEYVLVIGQSADDKWYFAASEPDIHRAVYSVDQFKNFIMSI